MKSRAIDQEFTEKYNSYSPSSCLMCGREQNSEAFPGHYLKYIILQMFPFSVP